MGVDIKEEVAMKLLVTGGIPICLPKESGNII